MTDAWREAHRGVISASMAPIILGVSPHHDATWLYAYLTDAIEDEDSEAKTLGRMLEPVVVELLSQQTDLVVSTAIVGAFRPWERVGDAPEWMMAAPDGFAGPYGKRVSHVVEAKVAMWVAAADWRAGPPPHFIAQCQHQMAVTGLDRALLGVLISGGKTGGLTFRWAELHRNEGFIKAMIEKEAEFHERVEKRLGPPVVSGSDKESTLKALLAMYPATDTSYVTLPPDALGWWTLLEQGRKHSQKWRKVDRACRIAFLGSFGKASLGVLPDGRVLRYDSRRNRRTGVVTRRLRLFKRGDHLG